MAPATANPVTAAVAWDHPKNVGQVTAEGTMLRNSRMYLANHMYDSLTTARDWVGPDELTKAEPEHYLLAHTIRWLGPFGYDFIGTYVGINSQPYHLYPDINISYRCFNGTDPQGTTAARYDGSITWVEFGQMEYYVHPMGSHIYYVPQP